MSRCKQLASITLLLLFATAIARTTQPSPTPERTGRSYSTPDLPKTPPPPGPQARSPLTFADITAQSGIDFRHAPSKTSSKYLLETMGGGVAIFDFDNDGRMDLFFTNGAALKDPMAKENVADKSQPRYWNRLYQQKTDGTFVDVTERSGLKGSGYSMGVAAADYDNDGYVDIDASPTRQNTATSRLVFIEHQAEYRSLADRAFHISTLALPVQRDQN